ncbi:MAG TPA: peptidoglycan binding domain-containing protein [Syntrophomonadaceae bacterium]|nr:peptidoglycan binding domain-containing protein [Syntrophomonadaceae bacterium]
MKSSLKMKVLVLIISSIVFTLICVSVILAIRDNNIYPSNLNVNNFPLGNVQKNQVIEDLEGFYAQQKLILVTPNRTVQLGLEDNGIYLDTKATLDQIEDERCFPLKNIINRGANKVISPLFKWDDELLNNILSDFVNEINRPAVDAQLIISDYDYIQFVAHKIGYSIDLEQTIKKVEESLASGQLGPIEIFVKKLKPAVTLTDLQKNITILNEETLIPPPTNTKIDERLSAGEQKVVLGKDSKIVKQYQVIREKGEIVDKVLVDEKLYPGYDTIIYIGTGTINK